VAGTANGEVKLFKVKNKVNLKLHNSSSLLPASSSAPVTDIVSASQIAPKDSDKSKKTKKKKEDIAAIMKKRIKY
jgi:hypothetical protein